MGRNHTTVREAHGVVSCLERLRAERVAHLEEGRRIREETVAAIGAGLSDGLTGKEIARALGVSHQRVYALAGLTEEVLRT